MAQTAQAPARRTVAVVLISALLGAAAGVAVTTHPFTDEGDRGPRLLGNHHRTPPDHRHGPGMTGEHARPGWERGDKEGWQGGDVPPGWAKHHESDPTDRHDEGDHGKGPKQKREHDR
jgi:hypothetical protein